MSDRKARSRKTGLAVAAILGLAALGAGAWWIRERAHEGGQPEAGAPPAAAPEPTFATKRDRGEWLFAHRGCVACHGPKGRGGVVNPNYVLGTVPALNEIADQIGFYDKDEADAFIQLINSGVDLDQAADRAPLKDDPRVLAQYHAIHDVIENGATPGKLDPNGPAPPLAMPSWKATLSSSDIDCLIAYLVSLMPWDADAGP